MTNIAKQQISLEKTYRKVVTELENEFDDKQNDNLSYGYGVRHLQSLIIFLTLCITFLSRAHISASIVAMTDLPISSLVNITNSSLQVYEVSSQIYNETLQYEKNEDIIPINNTEYNKTDFSKSDSEVDANTNNGSTCVKEDSISNIWNVNRVYDWPKSIQEMILGSFFLGYMLMMSPMGLVCQRWGGKLPLQISLFSTSFITFFTPWLTAIGGYKALCVSRVALGMTQAGTYPSIHTLISKWVPPNERGRLGSTIYIGSCVGSILAYHIAGFLAVSRFGWPSIFWVTGILCFFVFLLLTWIMSPSPQQNRFISEEEKNYILGGVKDQTEKRYATPWKAIFTSKPVWSCFFAHFGGGAAFIFLFSQIPTYLHHVIGIDVKNSGLLSSLPYVGNLVFSIVLGVASDYVINKNLMSAKQVRILSNSIATLGPAISLIAITFIRNSALAIGCLVMCLTCQSAMHTGFMLNYIDLAPNFSGAMMATGNTFVNIGAVILPTLISQIVTNMADIHQWRIIFFIVSGVSVFCNIVSTLLISDKVQPWNTPMYQETEREDPDFAEKTVIEEIYK